MYYCTPRAKNAVLPLCMYLINLQFIPVPVYIIDGYKVNKCDMLAIPLAQKNKHLSLYHNILHEWE